jgi:nitrous-oxide reductase
MKKLSKIKSYGLLGAYCLSIAIGISACEVAGRGKSNASNVEAAQAVYVAPGQHDELYAFLSGGFNGQLSVYGLPSGRHLKMIPVFSQHPENGYGYSEETKPLLMTTFGFVPWDDLHHPKLSRTNGMTDGKYIFANANNTPRVAKIDLSTFETTEIIELPNSAGNHCSPYPTNDNEYIIAGTRFSVPLSRDGGIKDVALDDNSEKFNGSISFIKFDKESGNMDLDFQIFLPGFDYDLANGGKGPSSDWVFFTAYNSEQAKTLKEINSSLNDKDFVAAVNWKKAAQYIKEGKGKVVPAEYYHNRFDKKTHTAKSELKKSVKVLFPDEAKGIVYLLPTPKSPHGVDVDPSGEFISIGGKLASVIPVHSFAKMIKAIENEDFIDEIASIPVLRYESVIAGEVENAGLGPLHTEYDGKGNAYTSMFVSSEIVKWSLKDFKVLDRIPVYYSVGHLLIPGGDTKEPYGKYLLAMNKITKDRYLPTGPELAQSGQLIDISGDKMKMLLDFPLFGEPHYAQAIKADIVSKNSKKFHRLDENEHPRATKTEAEARVEKEGNVVRVYMTAIRSHLMPDNIEGINVGDTVYFHVTNLEQDWDVPHGFAVMGAQNAEILIMPGETKTLKWIPTKKGITPFYCTDFCSALHQEMQGYARVSPKGVFVPVRWWLGEKNKPL